MRYLFSTFLLLFAFQATQAQVEANMGDFQLTLPEGGEFLENSKKEIDWYMRPEGEVESRATSFTLKRVKNLDPQTLEEVLKYAAYEGATDREKALEDFAERKELSQLEDTPEGVKVYYADHNDVGWLRLVLIETDKRMYVGYISGPDNELNYLKEDILTSME